MAKTKKRKVVRSKMTCPKCDHTQMMVVPKTKCVESYVCKGCGKKCHAKKCCVFCDFGNKSCCC